MANLIESLTQDFGETQASKIEDILNKLQLPIPDAGEYRSYKFNPMIFLEDYGCVLRIQKRAKRTYTQLDHPLILQPLGHIRTGDFDLYIFPAIEPLPSNKESEQIAEKITRHLQEDGLWPYDTVTRNIGRLPPTKDFPQGVPVVLGLDAVGGKKGAPWNKERAAKIYDSGKYPYAHIQNEMYGDLKKAFREAWPLGPSGKRRVNTPDPEKMRAFWDECRTKAFGNIIPDNNVLKSAGLYCGDNDIENAMQQYTKRLHHGGRVRPVNRWNALDNER